ncbi:unnamed protein product [Microthlaspi erraticum]|uniref:SURF1-like protein n=1 Tax=Microthlaspi erraticum TaxID=1685480 RepID=A0A6D2K5R1_9BRAS|nr:unnamed protein product [Microthlaspi erraticum]
MKMFFTKTFTRLIAQRHSQVSSTTSNLSAAPLSHPAPQSSTSLEIQSISSATPPTKKKGGSASLWFFAGLITYGLGETFKIVQTEVYKKHLEFRRMCLEVEPSRLNTTKDVDRLGFRRVVCKGVFDNERSIYVGPKPRSMAKGSENGYYVITPLLPIPSEPNSVKFPILVNRGWVPLDWEEKSLESREANVVEKANKLLSYQQNLLSKSLYKFNNPMIDEEQASKAMHVEVVGVVRKSEVPGMYSVVNYPSSLAWFFLDVPKLAQAMGFGEDMIYVEKTHKDMDESESYPDPRHVEDLIRSKKIPLDQHLYTILWHWSSLACFMKWNSRVIQNKMYSLRDLFCVIDTIGVGCVTKLDPGQSDSIDSVRDRIWHRLKSAASALKNRGKDMDHSDIEEKLWTINSILREGEEDKMKRR